MLSRLDNDTQAWPCANQGRLAFHYHFSFFFYFVFVVFMVVCGLCDDDPPDLT